MQMKGDGNEAQNLRVRNFPDCVKSRQRPVADVEEGHLAANMRHLGDIATRLQRSLNWNSEKEANQMLSRPYRKPWKLE